MSFTLLDTLCMLLMQQKLKGDTIVIRQATQGEEITTLDEVERTLDDADLVIADQNKPLCIAGVLGGANSGVVNETTEVYLEGAYFDSISVRKTAKRHGVNTDASYRYERE